MKKENQSELLGLLPTLIAQSNEFTNNTKLVLAFLLYKNGMEKVEKDGYFFITNKSFSNEVGISNAAILTILRKFEMLGFIERKAGERKRASEYIVHQDIIESYTPSKGKLPINKGKLPKNIDIDNLLKRIECIELENKKLRQEFEILKKMGKFEEVTTDTDTESDTETESEIYNSNNNLKENNINKEYNLKEKNINTNIPKEKELEQCPTPTINDIKVEVMKVEERSKEEAVKVDTPAVEEENISNLNHSFNSNLEKEQTPTVEKKKKTVRDVLPSLLDKMGNAESIEELTTKAQQLQEWFEKKNDGSITVEEFQQLAVKVFEETYEKLNKLKLDTISTQVEQSTTESEKSSQIALKAPLLVSNTDIERVGLQLASYKRVLLGTSSIEEEMANTIRKFIEKEENVIACPSSDLSQMKKVILNRLSQIKLVQVEESVEEQPNYSTVDAE